MKPLFLTIILLAVLFFNVRAQLMLGVSTSNYAGTNGIISNPSYAADSRHGFYLNLFSANSYISNSYYIWNGPSSFINHLMNDGDFEDSYLKETGQKQSIFNAGIDFRGPSFLLKLNAKSGLGFYTRVRGAIQGNNISYNMMQLFKTGISEEELLNKPFNDNTFSLNANAFAEFGLTYARTVWEKDQHYIKAGFTVKRLIGAYSSHIINEAMDFTIRKDENTGEYFMDVAQISAKYGYSTNEDPEDQLNLLESESAGRGWGFDVGITYEHRPDVDQYRYTMNGVSKLDNRKNKYNYKIGLSILDIGSIQYDGPMAKSYVFTRTDKIITDEDFEDLDGDYIEVVNEVFDVMPQEGNKSFRSGLPTAVKIDIDYKLSNKIYANLTLFQNLRGKEAIAMRQNSMLALTPRIEMKWLELAFPMSLRNDYKMFAIGTAVKLGSLFVGSDNLGGILGIGKAYGADVYMGLAIPFFKGKKNDKDNDGVSNGKDDCKKVAGTWASKGCPDADGDSVPDHMDKCPEVYGTVGHNGCPLVKEKDNGQ